MKTVTLRNSFHRTEVKVRVPESETEDAWSYLQCAAYSSDATRADKAKLRRVEKALCGCADCQCGTVR